MADQEEVLTQEEFNEAIRRVLKRSQTDAEFRAICLSDPARAVRMISGKSLPDGVKLRLLDSPDITA